MTLAIIGSKSVPIIAPERSPESTRIPAPVGSDTCNTVPVDGIKRSEEHTSELQSRFELVCRLLLDKQNHVRGSSDPSNSAALSLRRLSWTAPCRAVCQVS